MIVSTMQLTVKYENKIGYPDKSKTGEIWYDLLNTIDKVLDQASKEELEDSLDVKVCYDVKNGIMSRRNYVCLTTRTDEEYGFKVDEEPVIIGNIEKYKLDISEFFNIVTLDGFLNCIAILCRMYYN